MLYNNAVHSLTFLLAFTYIQIVILQEFVLRLLNMENKLLYPGKIVSLHLKLKPRLNSLPKNKK